MTITRLKAKNQLTLPTAIIKRMGLKPDELFSVDVEGNKITFTPVDLEPRYTKEEIKAIDRIVEKEKTQAKVIRSVEEWSAYLKELAAS